MFLLVAFLSLSNKTGHVFRFIAYPHVAMPCLQGFPAEHGLRSQAIAGYVEAPQHLILHLRLLACFGSTSHILAALFSVRHTPPGDDFGT